MKKAAPCCNYATHSDNATARPLLLLYRGNSLPCDNTAAVGSLPFEIGSRGQSFPQSKCVVAVKITAASKGIKGQEKRNENVNVMIGRTEESDPSEGSLRSFCWYSAVHLIHSDNISSISPIDYNDRQSYQTHCFNIR
ncbi:Transcription factor [Dirofilaria immitis]